MDDLTRPRSVEDLDLAAYDQAGHAMVAVYARISALGVWGNCRVMSANIQAQHPELWTCCFPARSCAGTASPTTRG
jgi:hypothetical protein